MSTATKVFLFVLAIGAMLWLALLAVAPSPVALNNSVVPLFCFVMGIFLASILFPWVAKKWPNSLIAKGDQVPFLTRQIVLIGGFVFGIGYMFFAAR